mmetsp:Transcript_1282/g.2696  ORF Transcript_1282/g.2696 Transcript_1282/m.2696 type:complete len:97 (-) Transcript_1282:411-701(-)
MQGRTLFRTRKGMRAQPFSCNNDSLQVIPVKPSAIADNEAALSPERVAMPPPPSPHQTGLPDGILLTTRKILSIPMDHNVFQPTTDQPILTRTHHT